MKQLVYNAQTGNEEIAELPDTAPTEYPTEPPLTTEQEIAKLKSQVAISSQAAADANDTQQQLLDYLIDTGVI